MSAITTHVLDIATGRPVAGLTVVLETRGPDGGWLEAGRGATEADGRLHTLMEASTVLVPGMYRLLFLTRAYFEAQGTRAFYPEVVVTFEAVRGEAQYHVPLLLSPYGYSTYRGT
jgi:5-hydroxyisourate hydrolase